LAVFLGAISSSAKKFAIPFSRLAKIFEYSAAEYQLDEKVVSLTAQINQISFSPSKSENLVRILHLIAESNADLDVFPEYCMGMPIEGLNKSFVEENAEPIDGEFAQKIIESTETRLSSVVFTMFLREGKSVYNAAVLAKAGDIEAIYRKIHLFDAYGYDESAFFASGKILAISEVGPFKVGLAVCFDLRFPELFRAMTCRGVNLFIVPSGWYKGKHKIDQWRVLTKARAHENLSFLVAANQTLPQFIGHSLVASPMGYSREELKTPQTSFAVRLELQEILATRRLLPTILNSKRDFYSNLYRDR
jgi:deaminated glutathione amidase